LPLIVASLVLFILVGGISWSRHDERQPAEIDEIYWIGSAYYFDLAFLRGDWSHPDWQLLPARENPPVGKYLIGAALYAADLRVMSPDKLGSFYLVFRDRGWGQGIARAKRQAVADRLSPGTWQAMGGGRYQPLTRYELRIGRALMAFFGFLCALGIVSLGRTISGLGTGMLAALSFVLHPVVIHCYSRVSVDIIALFFSILAVRLLLTILRPAWSGAELSKARTAVLAIAMTGTLVGAFGSKMNALVVVVLTACVWLCVCVRATVSGGSPSRHAAWAFGVALAVAPVVFVALDPTLHPDPVSGLRALVEEHRLSALIQKDFLVGESWLAPGPDRALAVAFLVGIRPEVFLLVVAATIWQSANGQRRLSANTGICLWGGSVSAWWSGGSPSPGLAMYCR